MVRGREDVTGRGEVAIIIVVSFGDGLVVVAL